MITPHGSIETSKKKGKLGQASRKKKVRVEKGRERAVELEGKLEMKLKEREERKVSQLSAFSARKLSSKRKSDSWTFRLNGRGRRRLGNDI